MGQLFYRVLFDRFRIAGVVGDYFIEFLWLGGEMQGEGDKY
ncbi:MAG: hypothetical protein ABIR30_13655 [Chitinophagaceae bacterium]